MKNEKDLIKAVSNFYAVSTGDARDAKLARFILNEYYGVSTFFLVKQNDFSSGIEMSSVKLFVENMNNVKKSINGEI